MADIRELRYEGYGVMPKTKYSNPNNAVSSLTSPYGIVSHGPSFNSKQLKRLEKRFDQKTRMTVYYCQPEALDSATGIISKMEPILTNSSVDKNHAYNIVQNCTYCPDGEYKIGNQRMPAAKADCPIYSTNGDGTALVQGLVQSDSTKYPIITNTHLPRSAELENKPFQIPTHVWSSAKIKLSFKNTCASAQTISLKLVRSKDTFPFNPDLNAGSMHPAVQQLTNHVTLTDKEHWDTLWSYTCKLRGLAPNRKQSIVDVNKTVFANYMRSTLHRNSQAEHPTDDKLGGQLLPQFKQTNESYNTVFLVISILQEDDEVVKFQTEANPLAGETDTSKGWNSWVDPTIRPVSVGSNRVYISGYVSNKFRFSDVYSRTEAAQMSVLQSAFSAHEDSVNVHQHPDLSGTWIDNTGNVTLTVTASSTAGIDYDVAYNNTSTGFTNSLTWIDDGNHIVMKNTSTGTHSSWSLSNNGTVITAPGGDQYTKQ